MVSRLRIYVAYVLIALALLLQACAGAVKEAPEPQEPVKLKVVVLPFLSFGPLFIAEQEGYFAEQGLEVEFLRFAKQADATAAFIQGEVDVLAGAVNLAFLNAIARGSNIKFVADKGNLDPGGCTYIAAVARRDLLESGELDNLAQLQGRRVAFRFGSASHYLTSKILEQAGLTVDDIEHLEIPAPSTIEAIADGSLDLSIAIDPWIVRSVQTGNADVWMRGEQVLPEYQIGYIGYGSTILDENPEAGWRFMVAYLKAVRQYNQGKTERNLEIMAEATGLDEELLLQACWPPIRQDGTINVDSVLDFQSWAVANGYVDNKVTEEQFWDPSFVEYAGQILSESTQ